MFSFQLPTSKSMPQGFSSILNEPDKKSRQSKQLLGQYKISNILGEGAFAKVYKAVKIDSGKEVALKVIDLQALFGKYSEESGVRQRLKAALANQQQNLLKCHSAHIIKLFQTLQGEGYLVYVLEYCNRGNLQTLLKQRGSIQQINAVQILKQLLFGLAEMHRNGIIHRDLKPANIFIHDGIMKIGDLGFSKEVSIVEIAKHTYVGSKSTMAPEVMNREPYGLKSDIWSIGVIFLIMLTYNIEEDYNQNINNLHKFIFQKDRIRSNLFSSKNISSEAKDFLIRTLELDQSKRLGWQQTLNHPLFLKKFHLLPQVFIPHLQEQFRELSQINSSNIMEREQRMNPEQTQSLQILNIQYLECRKAEFFMNNLLDPLDSKHLVDLNQQRHLELLYLLTVRCLTNISRALKEVKQNYSKSVSESFASHIQDLHDRIRIKFQNYTELLHCYESKVSSIIKDRFSKWINKGSFDQKQKFLNGLEGLDFTRAQHINYTYEKYIINVINELKGNPKDEEALKTILKNYRCVAQLSKEQVEGTNLTTLIKKIIKSEIVPDCK